MNKSKQIGKRIVDLAMIVLVPLLCSFTFFHFKLSGILTEEQPTGRRHKKRAGNAAERAQWAKQRGGVGAAVEKAKEQRR